MSFGADDFKALKQIFKQFSCVIDYDISNIETEKEIWRVKFTYYHRYPIEVQYEYQPSWKQQYTEFNHMYEWGDAGAWLSCDTTSFVNWLYSVMETEYDHVLDWKKHRKYHENRNRSWLNVYKAD